MKKSVKPVRFRASILPERIVLNHELAIELVWLEGSPILLVVDTHTSFQNDTILRGKRAIDVWQAFVDCRATTYSGYFNIIRLDQESGFTAASFRDLATVHGIKF